MSRGEGSTGGGGRPVPIVLVDTDAHTFSLDEDALAEVLLDDAIKNKPVCVVSVAGMNECRVLKVTLLEPLLLLQFCFRGQIF